MNEQKPKCPFCGDGKYIGEPAPGHTKHVCQHCGGTGQNQEARGSNAEGVRSSALGGRTGAALTPLDGAGGEREEKPL